MLVRPYYMYASAPPQQVSNTPIREGVTGEDANPSYATRRLSDRLESLGAKTPPTLYTTMLNDNLKNHI
jgi:hypothetical protein